MRKFNFLVLLLTVPFLHIFQISALPGNPADAVSRGADRSRGSISTYSNFVRRDEMIPMRDGVRLYTVILIPDRKEKMPIVMSRTPYGAFVRTAADRKLSLEDVLTGGEDIFADTGYIRVFQDIRGRNRSGGEYVVTRPLTGPLNSTGVDHSTDTYDTIRWLLENVPQNNGRFGMIGTSYDGLMVLMGLVHPHPALKAAVPLHPMVDGWKGDDWFHNGAFRQMMLEFLKLHLDPSSRIGDKGKDGKEDEYDFFLDNGSAAKIAGKLGVDSFDFWKKLVSHPAYDSFWQDQAMDKILANLPLEVPTLYVHGLWDQEDIYGPVAAYRAVEKKDGNNDRNYLVIGPWNHGGSSGSGLSLGPLVFPDSTGRWFRKNILLPFLDEHLKEEAPRAGTPPVLVYETGANIWRSLDAWPLSCNSGCIYPMQPIYLKKDFALGFAKPEGEEKAYDSYISDPASPVPYRMRPLQPVYSQFSSWGRWLVDNQEIFQEREDVLSYRTYVLDSPVRLSGLPVANLFAATSGTDADFVVKLIDEYPAFYPEEPGMAGYQLMISADIFRGRYRGDPETASPVPRGKVVNYRWTLPASTHVFLPGHRIMVQIQSSWFPLYDRNPQTYVRNIFNALPEDFRKATLKIYRSGEYSSAIELPVVSE